MISWRGIIFIKTYQGYSPLIWIRLGGDMPTFESELLFAII